MAEIMLCREDITMEPELITINETELIASYVLDLSIF